MYGQAALRRFSHIRSPELQLEVGVHSVLVCVLAGPDQVLPEADLAGPNLCCNASMKRIIRKSFVSTKSVKHMKVNLELKVLCYYYLIL